MLLYILMNCSERLSREERGWEEREGARGERKRERERGRGRKRETDRHTHTHTDKVTDSAKKVKSFFQKALL